MIDPEALVVLTDLLGDLRLQRETIDWAVLHAHLLSTSRLRNLAGRAENSPGVEAWIATTASFARRARWRASDDAQLIDFQPSGKSRPAFDRTGSTPSLLALRHRLVVGSGTRGEVIRSLHAVLHGVDGPRSTAHIAHVAGATTAQVGPILDDLVDAGVLTQTGGIRSRRFEPREDTALSRGVWAPWREAPPAPWVEAVSLYPMLAKLRRLSTDTNPDPAGVAAALTELEDLGPLLEDVTGLDATRPAPGATDDIARALVELADRALGRLVELLDVGMAKERAADNPPQRNPWTISWTTNG